MQTFSSIQLRLGSESYISQLYYVVQANQDIKVFLFKFAKGEGRVYSFEHKFHTFNESKQLIRNLNLSGKHIKVTISGHKELKDDVKKLYENASDHIV